MSAKLGHSDRHSNTSPLVRLNVSPAAAGAEAAHAIASASRRLSTHSHTHDAPPGNPKGRPSARQMAANAPMTGGTFITTPWLGPTISCGRQIVNVHPSAAAARRGSRPRATSRSSRGDRGKRSRAGTGMRCTCAPYAFVPWSRLTCRSGARAAPQTVEQVAQHREVRVHLLARRPPGDEPRELVHRGVHDVRHRRELGRGVPARPCVTQVEIEVAPGAVAAHLGAPPRHGDHVGSLGEEPLHRSQADEPAGTCDEDRSVHLLHPTPRGLACRPAAAESDRRSGSTRRCGAWHDRRHVPGEVRSRARRSALLRHGDAGEVVTYGEYERALQPARAPPARPRARSALDHYSIFMENNSRYLETCGAGERSGLYYTCINSHLTADELAYIVDNSESQGVDHVAREAADVAMEALPKCPTLTLFLIVDADRRRRPVRGLRRPRSPSTPTTPIPDERTRRGDAVLLRHDRSAEGHHPRRCPEQPARRGAAAVRLPHRTCGSTGRT